MQGKYSNVRLFQYGDMGTQFQELKPAYVTTQGTIQDKTDAGGTWANLSAASALNPGVRKKNASFCGRAILYSTQN